MTSPVLTALPADGNRRWKRLALLIGAPLAALLLVFLLFWLMFFPYVPPGPRLVVVARPGDRRPEGEVLAADGQKGILKHVRGEGWHFVWPIYYATERKPNVVIKPGEVGIVTSLGGKIPTGGSELADGDDERG